IERPGISCKTDAEAIAAGRQRGYDVIMQTTILRYSDGGLSTPSSVSLSLKMIDVRSRVTLWYLTGTLEAEPQEVADYIVMLKESQPAAPPTTLSHILLKKMLNKITK
ncbi:MAG: hypothetical protein GY868_02780, partial [Deltaproteobacteria bacterium]|nr:hypothetical protein [Deltaproteobacteria bacterium]